VSSHEVWAGGPPADDRPDDRRGVGDGDGTAPGTDEDEGARGVAHADHDPGHAGAGTDDRGDDGGDDYDDDDYDDGDDDGDDELARAAAAVEADLDVAAVIAERDDYLDALRRVQADFANFKKQTIRRNTDLVQRAAESLVSKLLPVLDACDGAMSHEESHEQVRPVYEALMDALEKEGLEVVFPDQELFDPHLHDAVVHEGDHGDGQGGEPVVTAVLRTGYLWKGRVLRPAMVKVKG